MTNQEAFDAVRDHLIKQNKKCESFLKETPDGYKYLACSYRANGLKCAVGALIPDDLYDPSIEGRGVRRLPAAITKIFDGVDMLLLEDLQNIHDCSDIDYWPEKLNDIAAKYSLIP